MLILFFINKQNKKLKTHIDAMDESAKAIVLSGLYDIKTKLRGIEFNLEKIKFEPYYKSFIPFTDAYLYRYRCAKLLSECRSLISDLKSVTGKKQKQHNQNVDSFKRHMQEQQETLPICYPSPMETNNLQPEQKEQPQNRDGKTDFMRLNL